MNALDLETGAVLWDEQLTSDGAKGAAVIGNTIFFGTGDGVVYAKFQNGTTRWANDVGTRSAGSVTIDADHGVLYVGDKDESMYALDVETGTVLWSTDLGNRPWSSVALDTDGNLYTVTTDVDNALGWVHSLFPNGTSRWVVSTGAKQHGDVVVTQDGQVLAASRGGKFFSLNTRNGAELWHLSANNTNSLDAAPSVGADGTVYVVYGGTLCAMNGTRNCPAGMGLDWAQAMPASGNYSCVACGPERYEAYGLCREGSSAEDNGQGDDGDDLSLDDHNIEGDDDHPDRDGDGSSSCSPAESPECAACELFTVASVIMHTGVIATGLMHWFG